MELIDSFKYKYTNLDVLGKLIAWMVICFVFPYLLNTVLFLFNINSFSIIDFFQVSPLISDLLYKPWSLISYGFFHAGLWHLAGNMIILYYGGRVVLDLFGKDKLLKLFFIGLLGDHHFMFKLNILIIRESHFI